MATKALSASGAMTATRRRAAAPVPEAARPAAPAADAAPVPVASPGLPPFSRLSFKAWVALAVVVLHVAVFALLLVQHHVRNKPKPPVAMELLSIPPAPPPPPAGTPEIVPETPPVVIPPPVIQLENPPPSITAVVVENPPPPAPSPAVAAEGPPAPGPARAPAAISGGDLSASMIEAVPPRYPYDSRRLKEQGTVVLDVLLGPDGRVSSIAVRTSSGHHRLDKAALEAVRRWRWSPTLREGQPVAVRGLVEIPFALTRTH